jgi:hypothetical protein
MIFSIFNENSNYKINILMTNIKEQIFQFNFQKNESISSEKKLLLN